MICCDLTVGATKEKHVAAASFVAMDNEQRCSVNEFCISYKFGLRYSDDYRSSIGSPSSAVSVTNLNEPPIEL